jgi:hypothetical protein
MSWSAMNINPSVDTDGIARGCGPLYRGRGEAEKQ